MKRILFAALAALCLASPAFGGIALSQIPAQGSAQYVQLPDGTFGLVKGDANGNITAVAIPVGHVSVSVSSSAIGFTAPTGATWCALAVETNAVRWRDDGTNPTASVGMPEVAGEKFVYSGNLSAIKFIRQSADATVQGPCYK